jgi:hypothetical protein
MSKRLLTLIAVAAGSFILTALLVHVIDMFW